MKKEQNLVYYLVLLTVIFLKLIGINFALDIQKGRGKILE